METQERRNKFWKSTPSDYAKEQTDGLDENIKIVAYPAAYLFRSIFMINFWMFTLVGIIIIISFKSIITNEIS